MANVCACPPRGQKVPGFVSKPWNSVALKGMVSRPVEMLIQAVRCLIGQLLTCDRHGVRYERAGC